MFGNLQGILAEKGSVVHGIDAKATVLDASRKLASAGVGALLVLDGARPVGILSERDIVRRVLAMGLSAATTHVAEVMTREVLALRPETSVEDAMMVVTQRRLRHLPVVADGNVVGMVSIGDLTRVVIRNHAAELGQLIDFITGKYPA